MGARSRPRGGWADSELLLVTVILYGVPLVEAILAQPGFVEWSRLAALPFAGIFTSALGVSVFYVLEWRGPHPRRGRDCAQRPPARILLVVDDAATAVGALVYAVPSRAGLSWPWSPSPRGTIASSPRCRSPWDSGRSSRFGATAAAGLLVQMSWAYCVVVGAAFVVHAAARGGAAL